MPFCVGTLFAFLVGWNADISDPGTGLDASWQGGLYMATRAGLDFGKEIVFTYGPLGFLKFPTTYDVGLTALSFLYVVTVELLTAATLVWAAHRWSRSWVVAAGLSAIATSLLGDPRMWELGGSAPVHILTVVVCAHAVRDDTPSWLRGGLAIGGGLLVGIEVLGKLNLGVIVAVMTVATLALGPDRRRHLTWFGLTFLVTSASMWFLSGQSLTNVDDYVRTSMEIVRGWPLAVGSTSDPGALELLAAAAAGIGIAASWLTTRDQALPRRVFLMALVAFFLAGIFKSSFTSDGDHNLIFFSSAVGLWFAFRWGVDYKLPTAAFAALLAIYIISTALNPISEGKSTKTVVVGVNPLNNRPTSLLDTVGPDAGRARLRREYRLSARALSLIGDRAVHISPDETSVAWAYRLNWKPMPIFQANLVSTPALDRINAESLEARTGPATILRAHGPVESALPPGATTAALLCRFRHIYADSRWEVLARGSDRCGRGRVVRRVTLEAGETVRVPQVTNSIVRARFRGLEPGFLEVASIGVLPKRPRTIIVDGTSKALGANTGAAGALLRAPSGLDYPDPFTVSPQARTISIPSTRGLFPSPSAVAIEFRAYLVTSPR